MLEIVCQHTLPMGKEAEHLQIKALTAVLPVRLRVLDVSGSAPYTHVFEPKTLHQNSAASAADRAEASVQEVALLHTPGHYDVVYLPAGFQIERQVICCRSHCIHTACSGIHSHSIHVIVCTLLFD